MKTAIFLGIATLAGALAIPAEAGTRVFLGYQPFYPGYQTYYPGPRYLPPPRYTYYYDPLPYGYEPGYEGPQYDPPRIYRPPARTKKKAAKPAAPAAKKTQPSVVSCSKASKIVAGYGFSAVKSTDCTGQVYSFKATRDGANFSVKLSSKNGELTEVKKL